MCGGEGVPANFFSNTDDSHSPLKLFSLKRWTRAWLDSEKKKDNKVLFDFGRPLAPEALRLRGGNHKQEGRDTHRDRDRETSYGNHKRLKASSEDKKVKEKR